MSLVKSVTHSKMSISTYFNVIMLYMSIKLYFVYNMILFEFMIMIWFYDFISLLIRFSFIVEYWIVTNTDLFYIHLSANKYFFRVQSACERDFLKNLSTENVLKTIKTSKYAYNRKNGIWKGISFPI